MAFVKINDRDINTDQIMYIEKRKRAGRVPDGREIIYSLYFASGQVTLSQAQYQHLSTFITPNNTYVEAATVNDIVDFTEDR